MKIVLVLFSPMPVEREGSKDTTGIEICLENKKTREEHISNGSAQSRTVVQPTKCKQHVSACVKVKWVGY